MAKYRRATAVTICQFLYATFTSSMARWLLMLCTIFILAIEVPRVVEGRESFHDMYTYAYPTHTDLTPRSTIRVSCKAEAPFELPYISYWFQLPNGPYTWLSSEDPGVTLRLAEKGNRTVTVDLWIGPDFYDVMKPGPNDFLCRATTETELVAFSNFTISKK